MNHPTKKFKAVFLLFSFVLTGYLSFANNFYVSSSYTGTTSNGALATPWKTLANVQSALGNMTTGDSVFFKKGDRFSGSITITGKTGIYFGTYGTGAAPLFWGNGATIGTLITVRSSSNLTFDGFNISDTTISATDRTVQAKIQIAFTVESSSRNNRFLNCRMDRIGYGFYLTPSSSGQTIDGCDIGNLRMIKNTPTSVNPDDDYGGVPVQMSSSNNIFTHNYLHDCWSVSYDYGYDGGGVEFFEEGAVIENNVIAYNTFYDCNGLFEHGSNGDGVANNPIRNNQIYYNKFINSSSLFWINTSGQYKTSVTNLQFYNNILVQNVASRTGSTRLGAMSANEATQGIIIMKNNVFQVSNGASIMRSGQWTGGQLIHTNNIFKLSGGSVLNFTLDPSELSTTQNFWQNTTSANPLDWDYSLLANSLPVNLGTALGLTQDMRGNAINGLPDVGILEYGASALTVNTLQASATLAPVLCYAGTTSVVVSATGGTAPYSGIGNFTVPAGTYNYVVSDASGNRDTITVTVQQPTIISPTATFSNISTAGGTTTVTITAVGGVGGTYQYSIDGGAYQSSNAFNNIAAGSHTIAAKDANGCIGTSVISITEPSVAALVVTASSTQILCNGGTSTITIGATGGVAPYTGVGNFNVTAGSRTYSVTDSRGATASTVVVVTQPTPITATISAGSIAVNGGTTSVTVSATGGTGALKYKLDAGAYQTSNIFNGVAAGTHNITVLDVNNCIKNVSFSLIQPAAPALDAVGTSTIINCNGSTSSVSISATGGVAPYQGVGTYSVTAGSYQYIVTDAVGSRDTVVMNITQPELLSANASTSSIVGSGGYGSIAVNASGGTAPYTYAINGGTFQSSNVFSGLVAGSYTVFVKDAGSCTKSFVTTVTTPIFDSLKVIANVGTISCFGGTAAVTISAIGGNAPYTGIGTFFMAAGTQVFSVTDAAGAISLVTVTLSQPSALNVVVSMASDAITIGTSTVTISATGGVGAYRYSLDGGAAQTSNVFRAVTAGAHTMSVVDQNACLKVISFTINQTEAALTALKLALVEKSDVTCRGANNGKIEVVASGGRSSYRYSINNQAYGMSNIFSGLKAGWYRVKVKDANQNIASIVVNIAEGRRSCSTGRSGVEESVTSTPIEALVYPNPSAGDFNLQIKSDVNADALVEIIDMYGKKTAQIKAKTGTTIKIGQQLKPGIYFIKTIVGKQINSQKIIKL